MIFQNGLHDNCWPIEAAMSWNWLQTARRARRKLSQKVLRLVEVHRCDRQDGTERVTVTASQAVSLQPVFVLQVSDTGLNGGPALHLAPQPDPLCTTLRAMPVHRQHSLAVVRETRCCLLRSWCVRSEQPYPDHPRRQGQTSGFSSLSSPSRRSTCRPGC